MPLGTSGDVTHPPAAQPWWREPTRAQWTAFLAAWFGWVLDAFDFTVFLLVMPEITKEFGVTATATSASIALTLLLRLVGGAAAGWAADKWGRKLPLLISIVWFATCDGAIAFAPSFTWVLVLRTLFGFGMGAEWTAGATLAMENWPARSRGIASGVLQGSWAIGYLLAAQAAAVVVPTWGWRGLFITAAVPALLIFPIMLAVKEDPSTHGAASGAGSFLDVWRTPGVMARVLWGSAAMACGLAAYYGLTGLYSTLLKGTYHLDTAALSRHVTLFNVGMMLGAVGCGFIAARRGVGLAITIPTLCMAVCAPLYVGAWPELLWLGALLGGVFGAGYSGTTPLLLTSLFPTHLRAKGVGLVYHLGALPAAFVPMTIAALSEKGGVPLPWAIGGVVTASVLGMAVLVTLGPAEVRARPRAGAVAH
jgi:SHS family lactate transporter-like MFS transporter